MNESTENENCPIIRSIEAIGNRWALIVIRYLMDRPMRFNEFLKSPSRIDPKTLSRVLKNLQKEGIVRREVISTQPFSVMYYLTEKGFQLKPTLDSLRIWGEKWLQPEAPLLEST
ncbi:MAG: helix-turn-helix transcriptional regulator [Nitrososphaerota archaeon]|nr:helix-turn-helix transcriptional regulator [Nitrososphaerota archaeon]